MELTELVEKALDSIKNKKNILGQGTDGIVYAVDEKVVLKVHTGSENGNYYRHSSKESAEYEFKIGRRLYNKKVHLPKYLALFEPLNHPSLDFWGVFMERIYGQKYDDLSYRSKREAKCQYKEQEKFIVNLGYYMTDNCFDHNTLFDIDKQKLFLYDLVRWERRPVR